MISMATTPSTTPTAACNVQLRQAADAGVSSASTPPAMLPTARNNANSSAVVIAQRGATEGDGVNQVAPSSGLRYPMQGGGQTEPVAGQYCQAVIDPSLWTSMMGCVAQVLSSPPIPGESAGIPGSASPTASGRSSRRRAMASAGTCPPTR